MDWLDERNISIRGSVLSLISAIHRNSSSSRPKMVPRSYRVVNRIIEFLRLFRARVELQARLRDWNNERINCSMSWRKKKDYFVQLHFSKGTNWWFAHFSFRKSANNLLNNEDDGVAVLQENTYTLLYPFLPASCEWVWVALLFHAPFVSSSCHRQGVRFGS